MDDFVIYSKNQDKWEKLESVKGFKHLTYSNVFGENLTLNRIREDEDGWTFILVSVGTGFTELFFSRQDYDICEADDYSREV